MPLILLTELNQNYQYFCDIHSDYNDAFEWCKENAGKMVWSWEYVNDHTDLAGRWTLHTFTIPSTRYFFKDRDTWLEFSLRFG